MHLKRSLTVGAIAVAIAGAGAAALLPAGASTTGGIEYTNAKVNPVAGYVVQGGNLTYINSYIGSNNSHSLTALPEGTDNGVGAEVCNSGTGQAIQVGVQYTGNGLMNVDVATGFLSFTPGHLAPATSNGDWCENGVLSNYDLTGPTSPFITFNNAGGKPAQPSSATPAPNGTKGVPAILMAGVPVQDTVQVQLSYNPDGSGVNNRHARGHKGQWFVSAQIVPYAPSTGIDQNTNGLGYTQFSAWVTSHFGSFNEAGFGAEANFAQNLTPLTSSSQTYLGSMAHMRMEYNNQGAAFTFASAPGNVIGVDSTSNGDSPANGGVTYVAPDSVSRDAFNLFEGGLVS